MNVFTEQDFIHRLNIRDVKRHPKGYNFKCTVCSDHKKRGYILVGHDKIILYCHNCGMNTSLRKYIELYEPSLFEEYLQKEKEEYINDLKQGKVFAKKSSLPTFEEKIIDLKNEHDLILYTLNPKFFVPAGDVKEALEYCRRRKIPDEVIKKLKFCEMPKGTKHILNNMLIFPCYYDEHRVYAFQGRSIEGKTFFNHFPNESFKVYNIFNVDLTKDVYIFESIIDSFCIPNSVAMLGTSLSKQVTSMIPNRVWATDNDCSVKGKKDIKGWEKALQYAHAGERVVIYPKEVYGKDANELLTKYKWSVESVQTMIKTNIFKGLSAISRLSFKLKGKR